MVIDIWLNLSMGTCTDHRKWLHHLSMDKSDVKVLEEAVGENASCHNYNLFTGSCGAL